MNRGGLLRNQTLDYLPWDFVSDNRSGENHYSCYAHVRPCKRVAFLNLNMLTLRTTQLRRCSLAHLSPPSVLRYAKPIPAQRRYFIQSLCDGFLDLTAALPIPPSLPPYSTTIILVTLATRVALLPVSIWVRHSVVLFVSCIDLSFHPRGRIVHDE